MIIVKCKDSLIKLVRGQKQVDYFTVNVALIQKEPR